MSVHRGTSFTFALILAFALAAACSNPTTSEDPKQSGDTPMEGFAVAPTSAAMAVGDELQITASSVPANASHEAITWDYTGNYCVAVSATGLVKAIAEGSATVRARTKDSVGRQYEAHCAITVAASVVHVTGVTVSPATATLAAGGTLQLSAAISPSDATDKTLTWSSSDSIVAAVDSATGLVTAASPSVTSSATITATAADGSHASSCVLTVTGAGQATLPPATLSLAYLAYYSGIASVATAIPVFDQATGAYTQANEGVSYSYSMVAGPPTIYAGSYAFSNYYDAISGYTIEGTLVSSMVIDGSSTSYDFSGTLNYSGGIVSSVAFDYGIDGAVTTGVMIVDGLAYGIASFDAVTTTAPQSASFSVAAGRYGSALSVTLGPIASGCGAFYTLDGSAPTSASTPYDGSPIAISSTSILKVVVIKDGISSRIASSAYIISIPSGDAGISVDAPPLVTVSLTGQPSILALGGDMTVSASTSGGVDSYAWYLDGKLDDEQVGADYTGGSTLPSGPHGLMVVVKKGTGLFSAACYFTVE